MTTVSRLSPRLRWRTSPVSRTWRSPSGSTRRSRTCLGGTILKTNKPNQQGLAVLSVERQLVSRLAQLPQPQPGASP
jgi:hypothetical protein